MEKRKVLVLLFDTRTDLMVPRMIENASFQDGEFLGYFDWSEGNNSCDCNRVALAYGHGSPEDDSGDYNCATAHIRVILVDWESMRVLYEELL